FPRSSSLVSPIKIRQFDEMSSHNAFRDPQQDFAAFEPPLATNQIARRSDDGGQQAKLRNAGGEPCDVAQIAPASSSLPRRLAVKPRPLATGVQDDAEWSVWPVVGVKPSRGAAIVTKGWLAVAVGGASSGGQLLEHGVDVARHRARDGGC